MSHPADPIRPTIGFAPPEHRREILSLLFNNPPGHADAAPLPPEIESLLADDSRAESDFAGLWQCRVVNRLVAALWLQTQPGRTASLIGPRCDVDNDETWQFAADLLAVALRSVAPPQVTQIQSLLDKDAVRAAASLRAAGFEHLTDLLYLVSQRDSFPTAPPQTQLQFTPYTPANHNRLARVVEQTYIGSRDCPQLDGRRDIADVLEGYRATGEFDSHRWLTVSRDDRDVGCLLLADHPTYDQWELVYVGVVPAARGRGIGLELTLHAQWLTGQANRERLVLAVDAKNLPALRHYSAANFQPWDLRCVFVKFL